MTNIFRILVLAILLVAPSAAGRMPAADIRLEEISAIGGPEADLLYLWTSIAVDKDGNIYCTDALDYSLKKFGPDGGMLKRTGKRGWGQGEFEKAAGVALIGDFVYAWDLVAHALQVFDRDLVFQKIILMPGSVDGLAVRPDGSVVAAVRLSYERPTIMFLSPDGTINRQFPLYDKDKPEPTGTVSLAAGPTGEFYIGYLFQNRIEKRGVGGERIWSRTPMTAKPNPPVEVFGLKLPSDTYILSLARDSRGRIYALGGSQAVREGRDVFIYAADGSPVGSLVLPEPSHSLYFDRSDYLYVSADGGVTVKKYRLIYEEASHGFEIAD